MVRRSRVEMATKRLCVSRRNLSSIPGPVIESVTWRSRLVFTGQGKPTGTRLESFPRQPSLINKFWASETLTWGKRQAATKEGLKVVL